MGLQIFCLALVMLSITVSSMPVPFRGCTGDAKYRVSFVNLLRLETFRDLIPSSGLVFTPLTVTSHSNRFSILTVRGFATTAVEAVAERGDTTELLKLLEARQQTSPGVKSIATGAEVIVPGGSDSLEVDVNCSNPFITALAMVAPSPDWIVQISNVNTFSPSSRDFVDILRGSLIVYDAGTDDSRDFTDPFDLSLDMPTVPQKNIAPLVEDETDRFEGRVVGRYLIERIN